MNSLRKGGAKEGMRVIMIQRNEDGAVDDNEKEFEDVWVSQFNKGKEASLIVAMLIATVNIRRQFYHAGGLH